MKAKHFILIVIAVAIMTCFFILLVNKSSQKSVKEVSYSGIITRIYQEPMKHNMHFFDMHTENNITGVTASFWPYSWEYAGVGDSIIKPPDTLMIIIKKPDGSSKEFFYRQ